MNVGGMSAFRRGKLMINAGKLGDTSKLEQLLDAGMPIDCQGAVSWRPPPGKGQRWR